MRSDFAAGCKIKVIMRLRIASEQTCSGSALLAAALSKAAVDKIALDDDA
jgi:hypothetical protein